MSKQKLEKLRDELQMISEEIILEKYITDQIQKEEIFHNNIDIEFSEDYIELFNQYVDLYIYQLKAQLPFQIIQQLIRQIKQSPSLHHSYMILKILQINFWRDQYSFIMNDVYLAQKLIKLCFKLAYRKILVLTFQIIKIILPIIDEFPVYQITFQNIIEEVFEQQRKNQLISAEFRFLALVKNYLQYFTKFHIEKLVDYCFFITFKDKYNKTDTEDFNQQHSRKLKQQSLAVLADIRFQHSQFEKNEEYFLEIYHHFSSNDSITFEICLELLVKQNFNNRECQLIIDEQIMKIFLDCLQQQSSISTLIIQLFTKILVLKRSYVQQVILNKKFQQILLHNLEVYITQGRITEIIHYLILIEILFQENCIETYQYYCPRILLLFIKCLELKDSKILLFLIDFFYYLMDKVSIQIKKVPHNDILSHKMIFRQIINLLDQTKSIISPEVSIDDDPQLTILRIQDLDITKQIFRKSFFEKWFRCI